MVITLSIFGSVILYFLVFYSSSAMIKIRTNKWMLVVLVAFLSVLLGGFRYYVGWDYGSYLWGFELAADQSWNSILTESQFLDDPIAFYALEKICSYFNSNFLNYAITSALCLVPAILFLIAEWEVEDDENNVASRALFIYLLNYYTFGWSAIKQGIALSICFYSLGAVFNRKPIKFFVLVIVASLFHPSAVVFILVYFLWSKNGEVTNWKKILVIVGSVVFVGGFDYFVSHFGGTYASYAYTEVYGANLTFILMLAWLIIFIVFRKNLLQLDKRNDLLIVVFAIGTFLQFVGYTNAFSKRIGEYFLVAECLLEAQISCIFSENSKKLGWLLIVLLKMFLFVYPYIGSTGTSGMLPYKLIFW